MRTLIITTGFALSCVLLPSCASINSSHSDGPAVGNEYKAKSQNCPKTVEPNTITIGSHKKATGQAIHWSCNEGKAIVVAITRPSNNCPGYQNPTCKANWLIIEAGQTAKSVKEFLGEPDKKFKDNWLYTAVGASISFREGTVDHYIQPDENIYYYEGPMDPAAVKPTIEQN